MTEHSCSVCGKDIPKTDSVNILAFLGLQLRMFCDACYSRRERGLLRHVVYWPQAPINSTLYTVQINIWTFIVFPILMLLLFFDALPKADAEFDKNAIYSLIAFSLFFTAWQWVLRNQARKILRKHEQS